MTKEEMARCKAVEPEIRRLDKKVRAYLENKGDELPNREEKKLTKKSTVEEVTVKRRRFSIP